MAGYTELHPLVESVLDELVRLRYSDHTVTAYRRMYANLERYAGSRGSETFDEELAVEFINHKFGTRIEGLYQAPPEGVHMKNYLRCMRVLLEWDLCGCVCKRMPGELRLTELPSGLQLLLDSFNAECRAKGLSESTVYSRNNRIKHFLIFLADGGGEDAACITESSAHDYVLTKASLNPKSVKTILTAIRCFYRHLHLAGLVGRDLTATVPNPKSYYAPELPATWSAGDVDALLTSIDRGNPVGKRDYAMLLMVARLGLRASDIKAMRIDCFDSELPLLTGNAHCTKPLRGSLPTPYLT